MKKIKNAFLAIVLIPAFVLYYFLINKSTKLLIKEDFKVWSSWKSRKYSWFNFLMLFAEYPAYRSVVYMRLGRLRIFVNWLFKGQVALYLNHLKHVGPGFLVQHGFATIVNHEYIGRNCKIFQQVTIGYSEDECPTIGDDVTICCGAKVIGGIKIGNDVVIGANAVVVKDIPDHCIVAGIPAKIIKRRSSIDSPWEKV